MICSRLLLRKVWLNRLSRERVLSLGLRSSESSDISDCFYSRLAMNHNFRSHCSPLKPGGKQGQIQLILGISMPDIHLIFKTLKFKVLKSLQGLKVS